MVKISNELWRPIATAEQAREIYKIGTFYSSIDETLRRTAGSRTASLRRRGARRPDVGARRQGEGSAYAWVVFALTFGLLISDYMARQVLNAVFPLLKADWA